MKICKESIAEKQNEISLEELALVNGMTKKPLAADEIFSFSVLLCDNEVDRDFERFTPQALERLGELFLGKTGIFDHEWKAEGQKARIYKTELVSDDSRITAAGDKYMYLKAKAYMLRTEKNSELIREIEGGIKREVSVGCAVSESKCSICGNNIDSLKCCHERGAEYDGKLCYAELCDPTDAYEWSFVAVPAQRNAGVMKKYAFNAGSLAELIEKNGNTAMRDEFSKLKHRAELGNKYLSELKEEVMRLGLMAEKEMDGEILAGMVEKMDDRELSHLRKVLSEHVSKRFPVKTQLGGEKSIKREPETEYLI